MPYKDPEKAREYNRKYHAQLSEDQKKAKREYNKSWWRSARGLYNSQRYHAQKRGISWKFTFESWMTLWLQSGHWEDRGPTGYVMCREGDEGPYSPENVYIAHSSVNKQDAWFNGKVSTPTGQFYE